MGNRQNLSPARNQKTTTKLTAIFQLSRSQSEDFTEKKLRGRPAENHRYNLPMTLGKVCPKDSIADLDVGSKIFSANEAIFCGDGWFL
jgi:hypothetical protein